MNGKYRVWDKKGKSWVSCNILIDYSGLLLWSFGYGVTLIGDRERYDVQYFTGLEDKNGNEIYEGDILSPEKRFENVACHGLYDHAFVVEWDSQYIGDDMGSDAHGYIFGVQGLKVIGNICENSELLELEEQ